MMMRSNEGCFLHRSKFLHLKDKFIIKNEKKIYQLKLGNIWTARKMPDLLEFYEKEGDWFKVPLGISGYYISDFDLYYDNKVVDHPALKRVCYDYQEQAIGELILRSVGLLHASTGSGKTQMVCAITQRLRRKTLIVVQNLTQMAQMVDDITSILGVIPTQVSGKKVPAKQKEKWYSEIVVCSIDSRDKIDPKEFGLILLDEADTYLGSNERRNWIGSLSPEYMYGLTGTVKVNHMDDAVFRIFYGPTTELILHHLTPTYKQIRSEFRYILDDPKMIHEMKKELYHDISRNNLIVTTVQKNGSDKKGIVFCEQIAHAKILVEEIQKLGIKTYLMIGEVPDSEREKIRQEAKEYQGPVCIVGSVKILGRGFDLPELSYAVLTTCERFTANIEQYLGRIIRAYEGKPEPVFYDIVDQFQYMLKKQAESRLTTFKKTFPTGKSFTI